MAGKIQLHGAWLEHLKTEFDQPYMKDLLAFLDAEEKLGKQIYPNTHEYFHALNSTPLDQVKVVILGQDPYHGPGQAHGLSFSVPKGVPVPPSLKNIYKELASDLALPEVFTHGDLSNWAEQGVLLLNSVLTVEHAHAASHQNKGWERFTDRVIEVVSEQTSNCVFLLWGAYAQKKGRVINAEKHYILKAPHPSPLSAYRGFFGSSHFSRCNEYLIATERLPISWIS